MSYARGYYFYNTWYLVQHNTPKISIDPLETHIVPLLKAYHCYLHEV